MKHKVLPGSNGEHLLQKKYAMEDKAKSFYDREVFDYITQTMEAFIEKQHMFFVSTADKNGECDASFRSGELIVLDKKTVAYPEFHGNGVMASLGNISENPHIGLLLVDFKESQSGLHINAKASIVDVKELNNDILKEKSKQLTKKELTWVIMEIEEAYIHCSKFIPNLENF